MTAYRLAGVAVLSQFSAPGSKPGHYAPAFWDCARPGRYLRGWPAGSRTLGAAAREIRGRLEPGGIISGKVTDSSGKPVADITVIADNGFGMGGAVCSSRAGIFSISQLPPDSYTVAFANLRFCGAKGNWAPGYFPDQVNPANAVPVRVRPGQHVTGINATMQPGATLTGQVTSRAGRPLRGICVGATSPGAAQIIAGLDLLGTAAQTNRRGIYRIPDLAPGRYAVQFNGCFAAGYANTWFGSRPGQPFGSVIDVSTAQTVGGVSTVMPPGGNISSTIHTSTGMQVNGCAVVTSLRTGAAYIDTGLYGYVFAGLQPGPYRVEFYTCGQGNYAAQWFDRKSSPRTATVVRVLPGTTRQVDAALHEGGQISGRLTSEATGRPLASFCVLASTASGTFFGSGISGPHGGYLIPGLNSGTYQLQVLSCSIAPATEADEQLARSVHVTEPRTVAGVNVAVPPGGSISGSVQLGSPAAAGPGGVCVEAEPVTAGGLGNGATTSYTGHYTLPNLRAGKYKIYFATLLTCDNGFAPVVPQWYRGAAASASATLVTVRPGHNTGGIDARLKVTGGISGRVTASASGAPLTGICVRAVPKAADRTVTFTASTNGRYSLIGLTPGRYTVMFSPGCGATGYATQWWHHATSEATATVVSIRADAVSSGIDATMTR